MKEEFGTNWHITKAAVLVDAPAMADASILYGIGGATGSFQGPARWTLSDTPKAPDDGGGEEGDGDGTNTGLLTRPDARTKRPSMYKVLLLNDDYTPMEFVVHVLQRFFKMTVEQATEVMLHVHQKGVGVCGIFPYDVAETKVNQVLALAQQHEHPLQCTLEKE